MTGDWRLNAASGGINVQPNASFELNARTASGRIDIGQPVTGNSGLNRGSMRGRVGNGGPMLDVATSSGSIRIR
jgi:hypothetical protein